MIQPWPFQGNKTNGSSFLPVSYGGWMEHLVRSSRWFRGWGGIGAQTDHLWKIEMDAGCHQYSCFCSPCGGESPAWVSSFVHKLNFVASKAWNENLWAAEKEGDIYPTYISTSQFRLRQERHRLGWCLWHIWPMCHTFFLLRSHVGGNKECVCFFFAWGFFLGVYSPRYIGINHKAI